MNKFLWQIVYYKVHGTQRWDIENSPPSYIREMSTIYTKMGKGKVASSNSQQEEEGRKEGRKETKPLPN